MPAEPLPSSPPTFRLFVLSEADLTALVSAVVASLRGEATIASPATAAPLDHSGPGSLPPGRPAAADAWDLTGRELEVLDHVARGLDNRTIAAALGISHRTVRNHVNSLFSKLGVAYRPQAVVLARDAGLGRTAGPDRHRGTSVSHRT